MMIPKEQIAFYALAILSRWQPSDYQLSYRETVDELALNALRPLSIETILNAYMRLNGN